MRITATSTPSSIGADIRRAVPVPSHDFEVSNHGTIFLLEPLSPAGAEWLTKNIGEDSQYFGNALAVEHRYIAEVVAGVIADGLRVR